MNAAPAQPAPHSRSWSTLAACGALHIVHDGMSSLVYVMLPVWAAGFSLSLTQAAALKTAYGFALGTFQVPGSLLSERIGERGLLVLGTAVAGAGYLAVGWAGGFVALLALLALVGAASSVQHALASSLVSTAFQQGRRRSALGTYNFAGDVGKVVVPGLAALSLGAFTWHYTTAAVGVLGLVTAVGFALLPWGTGAPVGAAARAQETAPKRRGKSWGIVDPGGFTILSLIGVLDNLARSGFLVLLPFLLLEKGAPVQAAGLGLTLLFAGGAAGKFVFGFLAEWFGLIRTVVLSELLTAAGIVLVVYAPLEAEFLLLPLLGITMNGTSTVLYGTVAELCAPDRQARAFALFYTLITCSSGVAPIVFGSMGDSAGIPTACLVMAATLLATVPAAFRLRA